jgi:RND family efflux transporter MFP subunit
MKALASITDRSTSLFRNRHPGLIPMLAAATVLVILSITVSLIVAAANDNNSLPPPDAVRAVRVAEIMSEPGERRLRLPGLIRAVDQGDLAFLHHGHLAERRVTRGQRVEAGQVLATLSNPALMPGLSAADARVDEISEQLGQLEREVRRLEDLHARNLVPTEELERTISRKRSLQSSLEQAQAQRQEAQEQLAEATLRAPFAGTIVELHAEPGQFIAAGAPVMTMAGNQALEVQVHISAEHAAALQIGQTAALTSRHRGQRGTASVREIGLARPGQPAQVVLTMIEPGPQWLVGQGVDVELSWPGPSTLTVPLAAIIDPSADNSVIYRVIDGRAFKTQVTAGAIRAGRVAIEGPLAEGDLVIVAGQGQLLDEENVRILP